MKSFVWYCTTVGVAILAAACGRQGSEPPAVRIYTLPQEEQVAIRSVRIFDEELLTGVHYEDVGGVAGLSCGKQVWVLGDNVACVEQLRYRAWRLGANGLAHITYRVGEQTSDCEQAVVATARAIKVTDDG